MSLREDILPYTDADGLVAPWKVPQGHRNGSGNGLLYTSLYYILLTNKGLIGTPERLAFMETIMPCESSIPGVYNRSPVHPDQEGPDDYIGLVAAASILELKSICWGILTHGMEKPFQLGPIKLFFNYCNIAKEVVLHRSSWLGRMPQVVAHIKLACGVQPTFVQKLVWCYSVISSVYAKEDNFDARILSYLLVRNYSVGGDGIRNALCDWAVRWFLKRTDMSKVMQKAFGEGHPLAVYWTN